MKDLRYEAFRTSLPRVCSEGSPRPHLLRHGAWTPSSDGQPKIWQPLCRLVMSESGWWVHERVIQPARAKTHRLEWEVKRGRDPDSLIWPDCNRPHDYW
jgi:hypothetical protein